MPETAWPTVVDRFPRWPFVVAAAVASLTAVILLYDWSPPFLLQMTDSEPKGIYRLRPLPDVLWPGILVTLDVPSSVGEWIFEQGWLPRRWNGKAPVLVKPVAGLPGDAYCVRDAGVWVNGVWRGPVYRELGGVVLPQLRGCWVVAKDQVLLLNTRVNNSLDSRYFGVVQRAALQRWAVPLWTWGE